MNRYYLFIDADKMVDESTAYYKVAIGESKREISRFRSLLKIAQERGAYFHKWDGGTTEFLQKCLASVYGSANSLVIASHLIPIKAGDLLKVYEGTKVAKPLQQAMAQASHVLEYCSLNYRFAHRGKTSPSANVAHVENLSK